MANSGDRHSVAETVLLLTDPEQIALREAENGIRQFTLALDIIRTHVKDAERPFRMRSSIILQLHKAALEGLHPLAGTWRNTPVKIGGNGRTARAVSYVVLSAKLDSLLPGSPTIPEQIAADKKPYYDSLEVADTELKAGRVNVGDLEKMLETMLARQLVSAAKQASGE